MGLSGHSSPVIPAKAEIQSRLHAQCPPPWIPAYAGMTMY